jgi:collagenase-like PrtC family protease
MKLIITTNWDHKLLDKIDAGVIEWVSGRLPRDHIGGSSILPENMARKITKKGAEKYIKLLHREGLKFNYLLDGHCTGNKEYSWHGANKISDDIKWISDSGADGVTVVLPHLVQIIKKDYPNLKVGYGGARVVWEMTRLKYYDQEGVDWIILNAATNRNFKLLTTIRNAVKCGLWLVANSGCMLFCNFGFDHDNFLAHMSNYTASLTNTNYFHYHCYNLMLMAKEELIRAPWIRPEDMAKYEELGYDNFIIYPNTSDTTGLLKTINAYKDRRYCGNLLDILSLSGRKICHDKGGDIKSGAPLVDNQKLKDFLAFFMHSEISCANTFCSECGYCKSIAAKVVTFLSQKRKKALVDRYVKEVERIEDGR